ncbi:inositol monophosphatase [Actinomadura barringtoniae]|uniref:inositol-phosphate phosphatase n=1 Tax=Actinomadura barringtoniae TaxID=1427535 RepID=A0A939T6B1_9ACTN|nr:inositol monophosphatase family protein [Actinomadura barringtoniae]MBO2451718.1 inositol monophosphatase [Actinomadura barringtoniae]
MADAIELLLVAREAVAIAHRIVHARTPGSVTAKGDRDLVTDVDLAVEEAIRAFLTRETPEIAIVGEEHGRSGPSGDELWWALDPVDGTANFARGIPLCAVSLGLVAGNRSVVAAIDLPFMNVVYTGADGHGAYVGRTGDGGGQGERIHVSGVHDIAGAIVSIGDFAIGDSGEALTKNRIRLALMSRLGARAERIRMIGAAAIDLAWVAHGRLDATVILSNHPWDTAAGVLLVREAGGLMLDDEGADHSADSAATIAVAPGIRDEIMSTLGWAHAAA